MNNVLSILLLNIHDSNGKLWCNDVVAGDLDCQRLAICLALELRKKGEEIIPQHQLELIFNGCDYDTSIFTSDDSHPRKWFSRKVDDLRGMLKNPGGSIIATNQFIDYSINSNNYVTFLSFSRLKKYYLDEIGYYVGVDNNNPNEVSDFIMAYPDLLDEIPFFGNKDFPIWVTTTAELNRIKNDNSSYNEATNVMNLLGLQPDTPGLSIYPDTYDMFFAIEYPATFKVTAYQPSSLNKYWVDAKKDLYLSYIKYDCFGKTYATDACRRCAVEQIHEPFKCKGKGLKITFLGKHANLTVDKSVIIDEGLKRLAL